MPTLEVVLLLVRNIAPLWQLLEFTITSTFNALFLLGGYLLCGHHYYMFLSPHSFLTQRKPYIVSFSTRAGSYQRVSPLYWVCSCHVCCFLDSSLRDVQTHYFSWCGNKRLLLVCVDSSFDRSETGSSRLVFFMISVLNIFLTKVIRLLLLLISWEKCFQLESFFSRIVLAESSTIIMTTWHFLERTSVRALHQCSTSLTLFSVREIIFKCRWKLMFDVSFNCVYYWSTVKRGVTFC